MLVRANSCRCTKEQAKLKCPTAKSTQGDISCSCKATAREYVHRRPGQSITTIKFEAAKISRLCQRVDIRTFICYR